MALSIIHFSDIHIVNKDDCILQKTEKIKMACAGSIPFNSTVIITISGDIAYSGKKEQYSLFKDVLDDISLYIQNEKSAKVEFVFVPGNHDCDFDKDKSVRQALLKQIKPDIVDKTYYDHMTCVQGEYVNFAMEYGINAENIFTTKEIVVNNEKILFVMINTAWMSVIKENPGRICMPISLFHTFEPQKYKMVIYTYHHPENWLNPDNKREFINHIRKNADILLVGHEHTRDNYEKKNDEFSFFCSHGKELQDSLSENSAFYVINFDDLFQTFSVLDFEWNGEIYDRISKNQHQYHKNIASNNNIFCPNNKILEFCNDVGIAINHFIKDDVLLPEIFVWPDVNRLTYGDEKDRGKYIRSDIYKELIENDLNVMISGDSGCKTAFAKNLFLKETTNDICCLFINGKEFTSSEEHSINNVIESAVIHQYSSEMVESFRQLPKSKKIIIIDDFDHIKINNNRRISVLNHLCGNFGRVTILLSNSMDLTSILSCNKFNSTNCMRYYEILPLGNKKRKELISKWYRLANEHLQEEEIIKRIEDARSQIDTMLGNGAAFIPAMPVFIISALQNIDAKKNIYDGSKYGALYESLIISSLSKISHDYSSMAEYNVDINILSKLAFNMLYHKKNFFHIDELNATISELSGEYLVDLTSYNIMPRMLEANIIYCDSSLGEVYRFKYPYIYYFFAGRYIAYNLEENNVKHQLEYMSSRVYNETYGNVLIFVCHFNSNIEVIDDILKSAYSVLNDYEPFDFIKSNPVFDKIKDTIETLVPKVITGNDKVNDNNDNALIRMDEAGIKDGNVIKGEETINDDISEKEKDMVAVTSALKTIEVLGQILQNYPIEVKSSKKIEIIGEMHKLGMRSVQAIIKTIGCVEEDMIEFVYEQFKQRNKDIQRQDVVIAVNKFVNMLITGMARGMVHQVANSLNSEFLLKASSKVLEEDSSISSKLILMDLKVNCLKKLDYHEIKTLKSNFDEKKEKFASRILDSIIAHYLYYNKCEYTLRSKLCSLCGFREQEKLIASQKFLNS